MNTHLPRTDDLLRQGIRRGWHLGAQLAVSCRDQPRIEIALGERAPGQPMLDDTPILWASSSKPVAAVAIGQLWQRGLLELDDPIASHVPEFAQRNKGAITIRHALTHTSGIRKLDVGWPRKPWHDIIAELCEAPAEPRWRAGAKAGYDRAASWFMLGEIIRRLDGRPFEQYVRDEIFLPLGMKRSWIGLSESEFDRYRDQLGDLYATTDINATNNPSDTNDASGSPAAQGAPAHGWTTRQRMTTCAPGVNGIGPMKELVRFYEMLLARGWSSGGRVLSPQTVEALTTPHRVGMFDKTFRHQLDWGLGFIVNSAVKPEGETDSPPPYGYGRLASNRTFGHSGFQSSTAFADPEHHLAVALAVNGTLGEPDHTLRFQALTEAIYTDLELVSS